MKRVCALLLVAVLVLTTGCGKRAEGTPKTESGSVADKTEDESGYEKELAAIEESKLAAPKKVAALSANTAAMWKLVGGKIAVGVAEVSGVSKDSVCGTEEEPDIEAALLLEPDLVLVDKKAGNYEDILSYLDMTEDAPPYITAEIRSFDDYADCMLEMAKYTKDAQAYRTHVIDVRRKNAEVIARGREALQVLIQTMPLPENGLFDESMAEKPEEAAGSDADTATATDTSGALVDSGVVTVLDESSMESGEESVPTDTEKVASVREAVTVLLLRVDKESCTIQGSYDYVSNMLADFGLVNVNPDTFTVTVKLPKEKDAEKVPAKSAVASETEESGVNAESAVAISGAEEAQGAEAAEGAEAIVGTEENADDGTEATTVTVTGTEANAEAEPESTAGVEVTVSSEDAAGAEAYGSVAEEEGEEPAGAEADGSTEETSMVATDAEADDSAAEAEKLAAAEDEAEDEKAEAAFEKILKRNPDYIFVIYEGKEKEAEKTYKTICESKEFWSEMTAVKNRRVYTLPQSTFASPPNAQWDLAYEYLYQTMFVM